MFFQWGWTWERKLIHNGDRDGDVVVDQESGMGMEIETSDFLDPVAISKFVPFMSMI